MRSLREHCLAILAAMHGRENLQHILMVSQPGLEGKTLADYLQNRPTKLLELLLQFQPEEVEP
jgi:Holliday junction resolvasome RuvABC ATP-dependent DNA helicase subunit